MKPAWFPKRDILWNFTFLHTIDNIAIDLDNGREVDTLLILLKPLTKSFTIDSC